MYKIGDYIVKSVDGICQIRDILHLNISGADKNRLYYLLVPVNDEKGKIYLPTDTADSVIRKAMSEKEAWELIDKIPGIKEIGIDNEKTREKRYKEAICSGNPESLISIIKLTYLRQKKRVESGKKGTVIDERYLNLAENNLYAELGFALNISKEDVCQLIISVLSGENFQNIHHHPFSDVQTSTFR